MIKPAKSLFQTILVFDTTQRDQTTVALLQGDQRDVLSAPVRAQELQRLTAELLASHKITLADVDAFAVLTGPGSFTGTRIGISATNTFGWLLSKPIIELAGDNIDAALTSLLATKPKPVSQAQARY